MIKGVMVDGVEALKMMVDGKVAWERSGLPAGYRRCEYLESDGAQYINTMAIPDKMETLRYKIEFVKGNNIIAFGARYNNTTPQTYNQIYLNCFAGTAKLFFGPTGNENFCKDYGNISLPCVIEDNVYTSLYVYAEILVPMYLFCLNRNGSLIDGLGGSRIYYFKMGDKVEMIPALDTDGVPCMYDTVSKRPFYNQGTGEFTYELSVADA